MLAVGNSNFGSWKLQISLMLDNGAAVHTFARWPDFGEMSIQISTVSLIVLAASQPTEPLLFELLAPTPKR